MKNFKIVVFVFVFALASCINQEKSSESNAKIVSTYYFIRHAEKDRSDAANKNPHLTEAGKQRAEHWNEVLKNVKFDAVYSTDYNRTKETAQPTATKNNLELSIYDSKTIDISNFLKTTQSKNVLVVGHSNTTPDFVNSVLGHKKYNEIKDNNNSNLYIVTVFGDSISDVLLYINQ
ncbi:histidine phosphatase family protein [Gaetbulibacter sp. M235]|uniref:SixA phosphatase family protein n=1 Tax=Gaetbulibacter sp. M235 TaxID=3126510 RepID=UPI00374EBD3C